MEPSFAMETLETRSPDETLAFGRSFAERLGVGDCVAMIGGLGAGKTVLVRGIAEGLGLDDTRLVSSPTYVLVQEYPGASPIFHLDLYRMGDPRAELADLGLEEMLEEGVTLIEWADRATDALPHNRWEIAIEITAESSRRFTVTRLE
ncbi:MAG: tRNA (adenosine(37)-N6)-threonylcarbamoyltransferase complex ATPase subunit type 1 TsaE [Phycisphaerae bacterium]|nr:tRNA (adenosine(37)-N6)-threonylcarbamoyltransferase complex ATPase subunit type 1 TsaE [Phycisphaerae bacterium]